MLYMRINATKNIKSPKLERMPVSLKFGLFVVAYCILTLIVGGLGFKVSKNSNEALKSVYEERVLAYQHIARISKNLLMLRMNLQEMILIPSPSNIEIKLKENKELALDLDAALQAYQIIKMTSEEAEIARELPDALSKLLSEGFDPISKAVGARSIDEARGVFVSKLPFLLPRVQTILDQLAELQINETKSEYDTASREYDRNKVTVMILIVCGCSLISGLGFYLVIKLKRQLGGEPEQVLNISKAISSGDLSTSMSANDSEDTSLLGSMKKMQSYLIETVGRIATSSVGVANASAEIAQGNSDLSIRTENQASALEQTAASMVQLNDAVKGNVASALKAKNASNGAVNLVQDSAKVVHEFVITMKSIDEASNKINEITGVIDGIAFQTNILALNAAVEAARAGEQGRGFAVVASEVRGLANRSANAAKEIKSLVEVSSNRVRAGGVLADAAFRNINNAVVSIQNVTELIHEISHSNSLQASGISQVGTAISELDQVTQQNAALVEEISASATALKEMSQELHSSISVFRLATN